MLDGINAVATSIADTPDPLRRRTRKGLEPGVFLRDLAAIALSLAVPSLSGCRQPATAAAELRIIAVEYGFQMSDSVPAGLVHITLRNAGRDMHEAVLVRFTDTIGTARAYADSVRAHVDFPSNAQDVGGAALTLPGDSSGVWLQLAPGHYAVVCWKGDHLSRGMAHDLRVVASNRVPDNPPRATRQLTLRDFAFELDTPFTAGRHLLHVRNVGSEAHEGDIIRVTPAAGLREYLAWLAADAPGLPPATLVAGFGDLYPGKEAWIELVLTPGRYFIICGVPAKADKRPHYQRGMLTEFSIDSSRP
jgi:uncharacterized cupredoxin-like copper-binding protein